MAIVTSWAGLKHYVENAVRSALKEEVAKVVIEEEREAIFSVVYDGFGEPEVYERRGSRGGLQDPHNIEAKVAGGSTVLEVVNRTPPNPKARDQEKVTTDKNLAETVEYGLRYDFLPVYPRPFTQETIRRLAESKKHVGALADGLRRRGLDVQ